MEPELKDTPFRDQFRCLSGFVGLSRTGYFGRGKQVQASTFASAITAVGNTIALSHQIKPTKMPHSEKLLPQLQEMLAGFRKEDPATNKKSPIEVDVPEYLAGLVRCDAALELLKSVGDNSFMAYYYLLKSGDYTLKRGKRKSTQTEQFKLEDCRLLKLNKSDQLKPL